MSITIGAYARAGARSGDGEVRLAKGTTDQLVNKGTFGNAAASFFRGIGEALHLVRPDPTRATRQREALEGFQNAMREHFGTEIANAALTQQGLTGPDARLTGNAIQGAVQAAKAQILLNRQANVTAMRELLPPQPGERPSDAFTALVANLRPPRTADSFTAGERAAIVERLQVSVSAVSKLGRERLSPEAMQRLADTAVKQVAKLSAAGQLEAAGQARRDLTASMGRLISSIGSGASADRVAEQLRLVNDSLNRAITTLGIEGAGDDIGVLLEEATLVALRSVPGPKQEKMLAAIMGPDSPLRAVVSAAIDRRQDLDGLGQKSLQLLSRMDAIATAVVRNAGLVAGGGTGSRHEDMNRLVGGEDLGETARLRGDRAIERALVRLQPDPTVGQLFLSRLIGDFPGVDEDAGGRPNWHDVRVLERLDGFITDRAGGPGASRNSAIAEMRRELARDTTLHVGLKAKLSAALDAMVEEDRLHAKLQAVPQFAGIPKADLWRLFAGAELQGLGVEGGDAPRIGSKWQLEHKGEGSLAGMMRGFGAMVDGLQAGTPLTAGHLEALHRESTRDTFTDELLQLSYKDIPLENPDDPREQEMMQGIMDDMRRDARVKPGFRDRSDDVALTLRRGEETTLEGEQALLDVARRDPDWFIGAEVREGTGAVGLEMVRKTPEQAQLRAASILDAYREQIRDAETADQKLAVIGRAAQELYRSHVFSDGNTRTVLFNALNRMLLENNLSPAILPEPRAAAGFTAEQFVAAIREGQARFQSLRPH